MYQQKSKKGFTIIEVVLVLAIAGLIFLMVFIALPALQKSQRDTQRRNDLGAFTTALQQYMTNNRGRVPDTSTSGAATAWTNFLQNYLNNSHENADVYLDPDGEPYQIYVITDETKKTEEKKKEGYILPSFFTLNAYAADDDSSCAETAIVKNCVSTGTGTYTEALTFGDHKIHVYPSAECDGENAKKINNGKRRIAFRYKLEGAGTYCGTN